MKKGKSPTQRTLALLKAEGWTAAIVEKWNPWAKIRQDLFGCIDILAIIPPHSIYAKGEIKGVQATSSSNHSARVNKSIAIPALKTWLRAGGVFEVWSWSKKGPRGKRKTWTVKKEAITLKDLS